MAQRFFKGNSERTMSRMMVPSLMIFAQGAVLPLLLHVNAAKAIQVMNPSHRSRATLPLTRVLVYSDDGRKLVGNDQTKHDNLATGVIHCGTVHGAGQLTLTNDQITTAAHVFYNEAGELRARSCTFVTEFNGQPVEETIDLSSIAAGTKTPYFEDAISRDWAVARLSRPILCVGDKAVKPYPLTLRPARVGRQVTLIARGHLTWHKDDYVPISPQNKYISMSKETCRLVQRIIYAHGVDGRPVAKLVKRDGAAANFDFVHEYTHSCSEEDGSSGSGFHDKDNGLVGIIVGWRGNEESKIGAPMSPLNYNFLITVEGNFKKAVLEMASKSHIAKFTCPLSSQSNQVNGTRQVDDPLTTY